MKYAYLTCELLGRDLDSRLLIAADLLRRGITCVIGQQWSIFGNLHQAPKGVVLFKTANEIQGRMAERAKQDGHMVVMSDEEVLAISSPGEIARITSPLSVQFADVFLTMDARHSGVIDGVLPGKSKIVGNARVDLLMNHGEIYRSEANETRKAGPHILFNTSFGTFNSVWGSPEEALGVAYKTMESAVGSEKAKIIADNILTFERANFATMKDILAWTRATFPQRVVLRPHPAEKADVWRSFQGVEVVEKTNPIPWLLGSDLMIHASSTTGLEGALLGTPCLNVVAGDAESFGQTYFISEVNHTVRSVEDAKSAIAAFLSHRSGPIAEQPRPAFLADAAKKTADAIAELAVDAPELRAWGPTEAKKRQIEKFDIAPKDFIARTKRIFDAAGVKSVQIGTLDRALFMLVP